MQYIRVYRGNFSNDCIDRVKQMFVITLNAKRSVAALTSSKAHPASAVSFIKSRVYTCVDGRAAGLHGLLDAEPHGRAQQVRPRGAAGGAGRAPTSALQPMICGNLRVSGSPKYEGPSSKLKLKPLSRRQRPHTTLTRRRQARHQSDYSRNHVPIGEQPLA